MTIAFAAAGTGGHVFPALAVAERLTDLDLVFFGGDRFEATAVPAAGHDFVAVEVAGLQRSLSPANLLLPIVVRRATAAIAEEMEKRSVTVLLATGGYVAVPAALAARRLGIPYFLAEQNAHAGLANRLMGRGAEATFTAFPETTGAVHPRHVGNPVRAAITDTDLEARRPAARARYGLDPDVPVVGVVGGSLGSRPINEAITRALRAWAGPPVAVLQLAGERFAAEAAVAVDGIGVTWRVVGFEDHMEDFFAAVDVVVSRASGMVAEIAATGTPAVLVPGEFGSRGHQAASAEALERAGAAVVVTEAELSDRLGPLLAELVADPSRREAMAAAALEVGRPDAAAVIAEELRRAAA